MLGFSFINFLRVSTMSLIPGTISSFTNLATSLKALGKVSFIKVWPPALLNHAIKGLIRLSVIDVAIIPLISIQASLISRTNCFAVS